MRQALLRSVLHRPQGYGIAPKARSPEVPLQPPGWSADKFPDRELTLALWPGANTQHMPQRPEQHGKHIERRSEVMSLRVHLQLKMEHASKVVEHALRRLDVGHDVSKARRGTRP